MLPRHSHDFQVEKVKQAREKNELPDERHLGVCRFSSLIHVIIYTQTLQTRHHVTFYDLLSSIHTRTRKNLPADTTHKQHPRDLRYSDII